MNNLKIDLTALSDSDLSKLQRFISEEKRDRKNKKIDEIDTVENKKQYWKEWHDDMTWEEFDKEYDLCTECLSYVNEPCICYAR